MASIPTTEEVSSTPPDNGYPAGLADSINKAFVPSMNMDTEVKSQREQNQDTLKYGIPRVALGAFTTLVGSLPGLSDEEATDMAKSFTPDNMYKDFLANKEGSQTLGALGLSFVPILGTTKLMRSEKLFAGLEKVIGARATSMMLPSRITATERLAAYKKEALLLAGKQQISFTGEAAAVINKMGKKAIGTEVLDTLKIGLATDAGIYAVANESDFFFPEEMSNTELAAFYGVPNLVISGIGGAMLRYQIKNAARDVGAIAQKARNVAGLPLSEVYSTSGNRFTTVSTFQAQKNIKEKEFAEAAGDKVLSENVNSQKQNLDLEIKHQVNLMASDNPVNQVSSKWTLDEGSYNTIKNGLNEDFSLLNNTISLENYANKTPQELLEKISKRKETISKDAVKAFEDLNKLPEGSGKRAAAQKEFDDLVKQKESLELMTPVKINPDGSMQLVSNAKPTYDDKLTGFTRQNSNPNLIQSTVNRLDEGDILKTIDKESNTSMYSVKIQQSDGVSIATATDDLKLILADKQSGDGIFTASKYEDLSFKGKTGVQVAMRNAVDGFKLEDALLKPLKPAAEMHHVELDGMLEVADKFGKDNDALLSAFKFDDKGISNFDDLEFASLNSKYKDFTRQMDLMGKQKTGIIKVNEFDKTKVEDIIRTLNLPNDGTTGLHPLAEAFSDLYMNRVVNLSDRFEDVNDLMFNILRKVRPKADLEMFMKQPKFKLRGEAYTTYAEPRKPVYALLKENFESPTNRNDLITAAMQDRMTMVDGLKNAGDSGAPMISLMTEAAMRDAERLKQATQVSSLIDDSLRSKDRFLTSTFSIENQPTILAIDAIRSEQDNIWRSYAASKFKPHQDTFNRILSNDNTGDLLSFNILVNQNGSGWRGKAAFVPVENEGKIVGYKVALENHDINKSLFKKHYGTEMPEEAFVPNPQIRKGDAYEPLVVSPLAAEAAMSINEISQDILKHINKLRELSGKPAIPARDFHMPAKNMAGKELVYLINKNTGELATVKAGNTGIQAANLADEEIRIAAKQGVELFKATDKTVENYHLLKSEAFTKMTDFSTPFNQTGRAKGTSYGSTIEIGPEVLQRMQESLINQYATVSKVTSNMIFAPEFKAAEMSALTSGAGETTLKKGQTIWNTWMNRAMGQRSGNREQTIGKFYGGVEDMYDALVQKVWDSKVGYFKGAQTVKQAERNYDALQNAVPDYNPFKDSVEFLENTMKVKAPHSMIKHMSKLNNLMGLTMLRMMNVGLALVNIGTLPTLIPPVTKALARQKGQSVEEWKRLNAAWSSPIGEDVAIWNPTRAFSSGIHYMFGDEWAKIAPKAAEKGHLWQKAVEELQLFTAPAQGYNERMLKHYAELSSSFVDKTETWSRTISYATFFNMGKRNLKLGDDAAMDFAHHMANRVIGDFRPNVRPQVYQGAAGMPFSLFTTFAVNYMQRVFGYVEKGQMKAFLNQMGLQTAFFGAKSLPGFNQYVENFTDNYDGSENLVDRMQASFGTSVTDAFLYGSVGSLTGLATYTKAGIPLPFSNFNKSGNSILNMAPAASFIEQTYEGIYDSIKSVYANEGFNGRQLSEIASRAFPIRNMQGWFDVINGTEVDRRGQVIDNNVRNGLDVFSRVSNIRTIRNQKVMEEFSRQRSTDMRQRDIREQSRLALRSAFRSGKLDGEFLDTLARDYLKSGGEPSGFAGFLKSQMIDGLVDKSYARALELATKQAKEKEYMRMMDIISRDVD